MLSTSSGSCYVGECSVQIVIPERAGDSKKDCSSTPNNSVKHIEKMLSSCKPSGPNPFLGSLSPSHSLNRERVWRRETLVTRLHSTQPPSSPQMLPYLGTSMGRGLPHVDCFFDARSRALHCVYSTPAGVF